MAIKSNWLKFAQNLTGSFVIFKWLNELMYYLCIISVVHDLIADPQRDLQSANLQAEVQNEVANQEVNSEVVLLRNWRQMIEREVKKESHQSWLKVSSRITRKVLLWRDQAKRRARLHLLRNLKEPMMKIRNVLRLARSLSCSEKEKQKLLKVGVLLTNLLHMHQVFCKLLDFNRS